MEEMKKVDNEVVDELDEDIEDTETTDWKAEAIKARGIAKRYQTKLEKAKEAKATEAPKETKPVEKKGFDYAEKAFLRSAGVKANEFDLVENYVQAGKSLDDVLDENSVTGKIFQAELRERREVKATKDAMPSGTKRSSSPARNEVDYWIAKGEYPPQDQPELRREVLNAKIKKETAKSKFTQTPVGNLQ